MNLSAPFLCQFFLDKLLEVMPYVDILFGNESEAAAFAEANKWETRDLTEIAKLAAALPRASESSKPRTVVFTHGPSSTVVVTPTSTDLYPVPAIPQGEVVDFNGAGDAFCGGFFAGLVTNKSVEECVNRGHYAAGVVIRHDGCSYPAKPDYKEGQ